MLIGVAERRYRGRHGRSSRRVWAGVATLALLVAGLALPALGSSPNEASATPAPDRSGPQTAGSVIAATITAGLTRTCAIETDGTPVCWGSDSDGRSSVPAGPSGPPNHPDQEAVSAGDDPSASPSSPRCSATRAANFARELIPSLVKMWDT